MMCGDGGRVEGDVSKKDCGEIMMWREEEVGGVRNCSTKTHGWRREGWSLKRT